MHLTLRNVILGLVLAFLLRFGMSLTIYNNDIHNHIGWMESVDSYGWQGIYERDLSPWASVNYPPLTLYSFAFSEDVYRLLPSILHTTSVHTSLYKLPSIFADCLIAYLIWLFLPFSKRTKIFCMFIYLFNPALILNSVFWGQVESLSAVTAIATIFALIHKRGDLAIILFTLCLLTKQNILPLVPLIIFGILFTGTSIKKLFFATIFSLGLVLLVYFPMVPRGVNFVSYITSSYIDSIGGQTHQHLASVNALNFWYFIGLNKIVDYSVRFWGILFSLAGVIIGFYWLIYYKSHPYISYWIGVVLISLWTFTFATRMHERHSYMVIAYLTFLLPYAKWRWVYFLLSGISFYNMYGVWSEYFAVSPSSTWSAIMIGLAGIIFVTTLAVSLLPAQLFHEDRIKT